MSLTAMRKRMTKVQVNEDGGLRNQNHQERTTARGYQRRLKIEPEEH
jgi:hypothetical protein